MKQKAEERLAVLKPGETIDATNLDQDVLPEYDEYGWIHLGHYWASTILQRHARLGDLKKRGNIFVKL